MNSTDIITVYEHLAGLTARMAQAALAKNWRDFELLEDQCARQVSYAKTLKPMPLKGAPLRRKISLLKEIMTNDRCIREVTEPWQHQLLSVMQH